MESRWQPWLLEVRGPYGTRNLPFSWLLAVRHELCHLKAGVDTDFLDPLCTPFVVSGSKSWLQEGHSRASEQPAGYLLCRTQAGLPRGLLGMAVQTGLAAPKAGLLCDRSGWARCSYQQSWKLVALCLKKKLNEISAVTFIPLFFASLTVLADCAVLFAYLEDHDAALK